MVIGEVVCGENNLLSHTHIIYDDVYYRLNAPQEGATVEEYYEFAEELMMHLRRNQLRDHLASRN